jgi:CDP-diacylglycerol--inositol 3-phosphatidyltransferase
MAQRTLFVMCAGNELFFLSLYLMKWVKTPIGLSHPMFTRLTWPEVVALVSFWVFLAKNIINFVQLWKASKILVGVDLAERAKARESSPRSKGR